MNITIRKIGRRLFCLILVISWAILPQVSLSSEPRNSPKKEISALYLYNFLLFVDWPKTAFSHYNTIKVAIYGEPLLYEALKPMAGRMIRGKKLIVTNLTNGEDLDPFYHVLFVGEKEKADVKGLLDKAKGKPILTVSHREGFIRLGGMVVFKNRALSRQNGKKQKRFIINLSAVRKSNLKIRSRLLRISDVLYDDTRTITPGQP